MSDSPDVKNKIGPCQICQQPSEYKCSACKLVFYCNAEHQQQHWKQHKIFCKPYEICNSQDLGRFLKATRDLKPGDIIFTDFPIVFGPKPHRIEEGPFPCVGCCRPLDDQTCERCPGCFWPICRLDCEGIQVPAIHGFECNVLRLKPLAEAKSFYEYYRFDVLIILRALYLQKYNKQKWEAMLNLQDHHERRGPSTKIFRAVQEKVNILQENYLTPLKIYEEKTGESILREVSADLIHKIYGILDVNATELNEEIDAMILYPTASLIEHNCLTNTLQTIDEKDNYKITFKAALPISKGEHITSLYTNVLWGTSMRRQHLKQTKYFICRCKRCQDPTEMGTYLNALRCIGSDEEPCGGTQLPVNPTEDNCKWVCNKCKIELPNKDILKFVNHLSEEVDKVMFKNPKKQELEEILTKVLNFLHPNHYLVYTIKHSLVQLYGNERNSENSKVILDKKLSMCEDLINITRTIDPGNARLSLYLGVLLNEQFIAKFKLLSRNFDTQRKEDFSEDVKNIMGILDENRDILQQEINTPAGSKLLKVICKNEEKFKKWLEENDLTYFINK